VRVLENKEKRNLVEIYPIAGVCILYRGGECQLSGISCGNAPQLSNGGAVPAHRAAAKRQYASLRAPPPPSPDWEPLRIVTSLMRTIVPELIAKTLRPGRVLLFPSIMGPRLLRP